MGAKRIQHQARYRLEGYVEGYGVWWKDRSRKNCPAIHKRNYLHLAEIVFIGSNLSQVYKVVNDAVKKVTTAQTAQDRRRYALAH
jgi:hypothetical protein